MLWSLIYTLCMWKLTFSYNSFQSDISGLTLIVSHTILSKESRESQRHYSVVYSWSLYLLRKLDLFNQVVEYFLNLVMLLVSKVFLSRIKHIPCWAHLFWYFAEPAHKNFTGLRLCFRWLSGKIQWTCMCNLQFWQKAGGIKIQGKERMSLTLLGTEALQSLSVAWLLTENLYQKRQLLYAEGLTRKCSILKCLSRTEH